MQTLQIPYLYGAGEQKWHIDYLATVKKEVETAIAEGLTMEQTVERVKMIEFEGYALFGWVHPGLNVPWLIWT